jgi:hypothetical protein
VTPRGHPEIEELLGAYALDAVDPDEAALIDEHLVTCPRCRAEVGEHREVAAMLGNSGGTAPEGVWDRIQGSLEDSPPPLRMPAAPPVASMEEHRRRRTVSARSLGALVAAAAVVIALLGVQVVRQERLLDDMRQTRNDDIALQAVNLALVDPDAVTAQLTSDDGRVTATAVVQPNGVGYLIPRDLPGLPDDRTYQLWGAAGDKVVSLGVLGAEPPDVVPFSASGDLELLVITEEEAGGVPTSAQPAVVAGGFD